MNLSKQKKFLVFNIFHPPVSLLHSNPFTVVL